MAILTQKGEIFLGPHPWTRIYRQLIVWDICILCEDVFAVIHVIKC